MYRKPAFPIHVAAHMYREQGFSMRGAWYVHSKARVAIQIRCPMRVLEAPRLRAGLQRVAPGFRHALGMGERAYFQGADE
jgi:hypothetical protein